VCSFPAASAVVELTIRANPENNFLGLLSYAQRHGVDFLGSLDGDVITEVDRLTRAALTNVPAHRAPAHRATRLQPTY